MFANDNHTIETWKTTRVIKEQSRIVTFWNARQGNFMVTGLDTEKEARELVKIAARRVTY